MPNDYKLIGYDATNITRRVIGRSDTANVQGNLTVEGSLIVKGAQLELKEVNLTSQVDGSNYEFTMPEAFRTGSLRVYWNGLRQIVGVSITITSTTEFQTSQPPEEGDYIIVDYYPVL